MAIRDDEDRWVTITKTHLRELNARVAQLEQTNATHKEHITMVEKHRQAAVDKVEELAKDKALLMEALDSIKTKATNNWPDMNSEIVRLICLEVLSQVADSKEGEQSVVKGTDRTTSGAIGQP